MTRIRLYFVLFLLSVQSMAQKTFLDTPENIALLQTLYNLLYHSPLGETGVEGGKNFEAAKNIHIIQDRVSSDVPFPCNATGGRSEKVPDSVHRLRPGDIDVIGAIGDSLTAGAGLFSTRLLQLAITNRGVAYTAGGQATWREYLTLPNILKEFNPNLFGYALGDSAAHEVSKSQFNIAVIGALSRDMPYMAQKLVERMKNDPRVKIKKHWKLISLWIGHNDFCTDLCYASSPRTFLKDHARELIDTLRIFRDNLPRTFVALIPPFYLKNLVDAEINTIQCYFTRNFECPCLFGLMHRSRRAEYYDIMKKWQLLEEKIAEYDEFQRDDFTVEVQPMTTESTFPRLPNGEVDLRYFAADCFHLSQRSSSILANNLWNNMLEPVGKKKRILNDNIFEEFHCPSSETPYLATRRNSAENELLS